MTAVLQRRDPGAGLGHGVGTPAHRGGVVATVSVSWPASYGYDATGWVLYTVAGPMPEALRTLGSARLQQLP